MHSRPLTTLLSGDYFTFFTASTRTDRSPSDLTIDRPFLFKLEIFLFCVLATLPILRQSDQQETVDTTSVTVMSSASRPSICPLKKTANRPTTSAERTQAIPAQGRGKPERPSYSWTRTWRRDLDLADATTTESPRHTGGAAPSTDARQVKRDGLPANVDMVRIKLSTAKSHLSILQTLLNYQEYEGSLDEIRDRILMQQGKVNSLEQHLRDLQPKEKKPKPRRLTGPRMFSDPQRAGPLRTFFQKK